MPFIVHGRTDEKIVETHNDGSYTKGFTEWGTWDCGCDGDYHGTCGDYTSRIDRSRPIETGRWHYDESGKLHLTPVVASTDMNAVQALIRDLARERP